MASKKVIVIAVITVILISIVIAGVILLKNNDKEQLVLPETYDGYKMDLSDAVSVAIGYDAIDNETKNNVSYSQSLLINSDMSETAPIFYYLGDSQSLSADYNKVLYKFDKDGNIKKVIMKSNESQDVSYSISDVSVINDRYITIKTSDLDSESTCEERMEAYYEKTGYYLDPCQSLTYMIDVKTGNIFLLNHIWAEKGKSGSYNICCIASDNHIYCYISGSQTGLYKLTVNNNKINSELIFGESFTSVSVSKDDIVCLKHGTSSSFSILYPSGYVEKYDNVIELGNNYYESVEYSNDFFPIHGKRIAGYKTIEDYNFTAEESYAIAVQSMKEYSVYFNIGSKSSIFYAHWVISSMTDFASSGNGLSKIRVFEIKDDLTYDYSIIDLPFKPKIFGYIKEGPGTMGTFTCYYYEANRVDAESQSKSALCDGLIYHLSNECLTIFDLNTRIVNTKSIENVYRFENMSIVDGCVHIVAISNKLETIEYTMDEKGNEHTSTYERYPHKITTIYALNGSSTGL